MARCCSDKSCFYRSCTGASSFTARYIYGIIFLLTTIIAWMVRDYSHRALQGLHFLNGCHGDHNCLGTEGVLRISLGCFTFFFTMYLTTVGTKDLDDSRSAWHCGWWPLKSLIWVFVIVVPFFIPSAFIQVYGEMARFGAGIFLIIQLLSVINFVFWWNDKWLSEKNVQRLQWAIVAVTVLAFAASLTGLIIMYVWFAPAPSCSLNIFFITWTLVLILVFTLISLHSKINAGLLTSGVLAVYVVFLCWSAIMSEPAAVTCNTRPRQTGKADWITIVSFLIAISAIIVSTFSTGIDSKSFSMTSEEAPAEGGVPYGYGFFHFVFAMGSMYFAMLFVGWNLHQTAHKWSIDVGWASVWVKIVNEWLTALVYIWCMVGPFVLRDREF